MFTSKQLHEPYILPQKHDNNPKAPSSEVLLKSKNCLDRLGNRICQQKSLNNSGETLKCVQQIAKNIKYTIQQKIQSSFNNVLNQQTHVNINQLIIPIQKDKANAVKQLMSNYWQKQQQNQSQARRKMMIVCKQNLFPKIKNNQNTEQNNSAKKNKKKAVISSLNVKIYEKQKQRQSIKRTKQQKILAYLYSYMVHVIDYKIQNDTPEFLLFQKLNYTKWDQIQHALKAIQNFCRKYEIEYCTLDLQKVMQLIDSKIKVSDKNIKSTLNIAAQNFQSTHTISSENKISKRLKRIYTPHQLLGCLQNSQEISTKNCKKAGIRYYGNKGKLRAIIKIQSVCKGKIIFQRSKKARQAVKKIIKIQRAFRLYLNYCKTKQIIKQKCMERYKWFTENQQKFRSSYRINQLTKKIKYQIHICSDSQSQWQRISSVNFLQRQNSYLSRIFKAFRQNQIKQTRIIFITAIPISKQIINYYNKLLELGGATNYKNRIIFMSPQKSQRFIDKIPLTRVLYYCPTILKKIKSIINNQFAYIIPSIPSIDYVSLCHFLNIPLYSSNPQTLLHLQSCSGRKAIVQKLVKESPQQNIIPYSINIYSLNTLASQLTLMIQTKPNICRWILKIDNQSNSRGLAYLQVNKIIPKRMLKYLRKIHSQHISTQNDTILQQIKLLTKQIYSFVYKCLVQGQNLTIISKQIYHSQQQYLNFYYSNGGIIQAQLHKNQHQIQNICFTIQIQPDNQWKFLNTYKKISVKNKSMCCYYQSQLIQPPLQISYIVQQLINKKCFGYFVLDFIKQIGNMDNNKIYFNGIKCYLDQYSSGGLMRQFISKQSHMLFIPYIPHENIKKINMPTFFHLCRLQNISFDIQRKVGNIFMFLDGLESGCLGLMAFNNSSKIQTFIHAAQVLDFFSSKINHLVTSGPSQQFLVIRNSINGYLNTLRKQKLAFKTKQQNINKEEPRKRNKKSMTYKTYKDKQYLI